MSVVFGPLVSISTYRRWAYLILGGALLVPYVLAGVVLVPLAVPTVATFDQVGMLFVVLLVMAVIVLATSFIPAVRVLEGTAARELLGGPLAETGLATVLSWERRRRNTAWFVLHIISGGVVSLGTLIIPPTVVGGFVALFRGELDVAGARIPVPKGWAGIWIPLVTLVALAVLGYVAAGIGALLARLAPHFLGPSPAERLANAERRAARLAERNRLARELHDSVGHALSVVSIQAGAAGRVLDRDPEFARKALAAIEESARTALADLDHVLGLLREDREASRAPVPTLGEVHRLLESTRLAGVEVAAEVTGDLAALPAVVSREAYRIVQELLTNALRHAGRVPVAVRMAVDGHALLLSVTNPLGTATVGTRSGGGRGLRGIEERVTVLRGQLSAGAADGRWRVEVRLPLHSGPSIEQGDS